MWGLGKSGRGLWTERDCLGERELGMERANEDGGWVLATAARLATPRTGTSTNTSRTRSLELGCAEKYLQYRQSSIATITSTTLALYYSTDCIVPAHATLCAPCCACFPGHYYSVFTYGVKSCHKMQRRANTTGLSIITSPCYAAVVPGNRYGNTTNMGEKQRANVRNCSLCV